MLRLSCYGKTVHLDLYFFLYLSGVEGEERRRYQDGFTTWGSTTSGPQRSEGYSFKETDFLLYTVHDETVHEDLEVEQTIDHDEYHLHTAPPARSQSLHHEPALTKR